MGRRNSITREKFETDILLCDALSGEFVPKPDQRKRTQTLGRIVAATLCQGTYSAEEQVGIRIPMFTLPLGWAKGIICQVDGEFTSQGDNHQVIRTKGVMLKDEDDPDRYLYITNLYPDTLDISTPKEDLAYSLRLGRGIQSARAAATTAARDFFNNTIYPINSTQK